MLIAIGPIVPAQSRDRSSDHPAPRPERWWIRSFTSQSRTLAAGPVDVCFIGDSLTEFWTSTGKSAWESAFRPMKCVNLGIAGDRTENILYRVRISDFRRARPKAFVLLAGTNNLGAAPPDRPDSVCRGIEAIVRTLRAKVPDARVSVVSILPNSYDPGSPLRQAVRQTNRLLAARAAAKSGFDFIDCHDDFVESDGRWKSGLTLDGTHLTAGGYDRLAARLAQRLRVLPEPFAAPQMAPKARHR